MTKKKISSEQVKKKFVFQLNEESAIVSHYLQNRYTKFDKTYSEEALQLLSDYNEVTDATSGMVCESPIQYNLFNEVFAVPFSAPENPKFTFIDLFAGIGAVSSAFQDRQLITNDILFSNYISNYAWFGAQQYNRERISEMIDIYNALEILTDNYMSDTFSDTFFSRQACRKIGYIREDIECQFKEGNINAPSNAKLPDKITFKLSA